MSKSDQHIKDLFDDYKIDYDPSSWSAMEDKINSELEPEVSFDREIQEKLRSHTEAYDHTTWPVLEQKMTERAALRQKIIVTKSLEVLAIFLLIFSVGNYSNTPLLPNKSIQYALENGQLEQSKQGKTQYNQDIAESPLERQDLKPATQNTDATLTTFASTPEVQLKVQGGAQFQNILQQNEGISSIINTPINSDQSIQSATNLDINNHLQIENRAAKEVAKELILETRNNRLDTNLGPTAPTIAIAPRAFVAPESTLTSDPLTSDIHQVLGEIEILESSIAALTYQRDDLPEVKALSLLTIASSPKQRDHYISGVASIDVNLINRPLDFQLLEDPINYGDVGQSFGVLYASKQGRHEIETGIIYSQQTTNPNQTEKISIDNSYYDREFNLQKFDLFKIPLDIKYHFVDTRESSFYASIGLDLNIIGDATYEFTDRLKSGTPKPISKIQNRSTLEKRKDRKGGLFDGGNLQNNSFVNVGGGLGYLYHLGEYSLFTEANYKHHIFAAKLGPNNEKIHTLSFKAGVRKRI